MMSHDQPAFEDRLRKLEEHAGFTEHLSDQLHEQLVALTARIESVARRLSSIESRVTGLAERTDRGFDAVARRISSDDADAEHMPNESNPG